jgi:hypothetical protein
VTDQVDDFAYLWTSEREDWGVLRHDSGDVGLPYNVLEKDVLLIDENDDLAAAVVRRMIAEGMSIISSLSE